MRTHLFRVAGASLAAWLFCSTADAQTTTGALTVAKPQAATISSAPIPLPQIRTDEVDPIEFAIDVEDPAKVANEIYPKADPIKLDEVARLTKDLEAKKDAAAKAAAETNARRAVAASQNDPEKIRALDQATSAQTKADQAVKDAEKMAKAAEEAVKPPKGKTLSLMIDRQPVEYINPIRFSYGDKKVLVEVKGQSLPKKLTAKGTRDVSVSLEIEAERRAVAAGGRVRLVAVSTGGKWIAWFVGAGVLGLVVVLGSFTNLLRDVQVLPSKHEKKSFLQKLLPEFSAATSDAPPFSLARVQIAFWTVLVFWGWLYIWLVSGQVTGISDTVLGLLGVATGTLLGARIIDVSKSATARGLQARINAQKQRVANLKTMSEVTAGNPPSPTPAALQAEKDLAVAEASLVTTEQQVTDLVADCKWSQGLLNDVLSDEAGISIHRFQMVLWTAVLGALFIRGILGGLRMPELDISLLALMGISSGAYLGFKVPEKNTVLPPK